MASVSPSLCNSTFQETATQVPRQDPSHTRPWHPQSQVSGKPTFRHCLPWPVSPVLQDTAVPLSQGSEPPGGLMFSHELGDNTQIHWAGDSSESHSLHGIQRKSRGSLNLMTPCLSLRHLIPQDTLPASERNSLPALGSWGTVFREVLHHSRWSLVSARAGAGPSESRLTSEQDIRHQWRAGIHSCYP